MVISKNRGYVEFEELIRLEMWGYPHTDHDIFGAIHLTELYKMKYIMDYIEIVKLYYIPYGEILYLPYNGLDFFDLLNKKKAPYYIVEFKKGGNRGVFFITNDFDFPPNKGFLRLNGVFEYGGRVKKLK